MSSKNRVNRIEKRLHMADDNEPIEYYTLLCVDKIRSFAAMVKYAREDFSSWHNGWLNVMQGKKHLGQTSFEEEPEVVRHLNKVYNQAQEKIRHDAKTGGVILYVSLLKDESGKIS